MSDDFALISATLAIVATVMLATGLIIAGVDFVAAIMIAFSFWAFFYAKIVSEFD